MYKAIKALGIAFKQSFKHINMAKAQIRNLDIPNQRRLGQQHQSNKIC